MRIATVADVEVYQAGRAPFTSSTKPSANAVGRLCEDVTAELTSDLLAVGFDITGYPTGVPTPAQEQLRAVIAKLGAREVERVAPNKTESSLRHYEKMAGEARKALLSDGPIGMAPTTGSAKPAFNIQPATRMFGRDMLL